MKTLDADRRNSVREKARQLGLPVRVERPDGTVQQLADFDGDRPIYFTTNNVQAAISTGAQLLQASPYGLDGAGVTVGVWDGGSALAAHQEFSAGNRVVVQDGSSPIDHATHVGGTIAAAGVGALARGMAPAAVVHSYDWDSDKYEMFDRAAFTPGDGGKIYLSNHSYGVVSGWNYVGDLERAWDWTGDGSDGTAIDQDFGRYNDLSRDSDLIAFYSPYYLMVRSAGNDRADSPAQGDTVAFSINDTVVVADYDSAFHPKGDGVYRDGFDTLGFDALAKNVLTVGSTEDAVTGNVRNAAEAGMSYFSSWGPTDDGRIKPDLVANGEALYSSLSGASNAYGIYSGTSMAAPNAAGSAALVLQDYTRLFPGGSMRSGTLKALLIHTADDLGNAGPDYKFGWGLMNAKAAVDLVRDHAAHPSKIRINEDLITSTRPSVTHTFVWDGVSPIRATLCWTDPAGAANTTSDLRTPSLRNNLDLKITGPTGGDYLPYVMPFVGTWTPANLNAVAVTGQNTTDNVEQVDLASPPAAGLYRCVITYTGTLAGDHQHYSLLISGSADLPVALALTSVSPNRARAGTASVPVTVTGEGLQPGTALKLKRTGCNDIAATGVTLINGVLNAQFDLAGAPLGAWDLVATDAGGQTATSTEGFAVAIWADGFDTVGDTFPEWSTGSTGDYAWSITDEQTHTPIYSAFVSGPAAQSITELIWSGAVIPAAATNLQFKFWHRYALQNALDCGRLEFSLNGGAWFDVTDAGSGAAFAANGYNTTVSSTGSATSINPYAGRQAWSGTTNGAFVESVVNLTDTAKYAGQTLSVRWRLATNGTVASAGWFIDTVSLNGTINQAPLVVTPAAAATTETVTEADVLYGVVRARSIALAVAATDDGGEPALTYTWSASNANGHSVAFNVNGSNAAKNTIATFTGAGDYLLTATIRDAQALTTLGGVNIRVVATLDGLDVTPAVASVEVGAQQVFVATAVDQFAAVLAPQPTVNWSVSGGGTIATTGAFTATTAGGPHTVTATSGLVSATSAVTVTASAATGFSTWASAQGLSGTDAGLLADPDGDGLANLLEYATGTSPTAASAGTPVVVLGQAGNGLTLSYPRIADPALTYTVEATDDLAGTWATVAASGNPSTGAANVAGLVTIADSVQLGAHPRRFLRLRIHYGGNAGG